MKPAILVLLSIWISCGPSNRDAALARVARYHGDRLVLFNLAREVTEKRYKLVHSDETTLLMQTKAVWYYSSGVTVGQQPGDSSLMLQNDQFTPYKGLRDKSLRIELTIKLLPDGENWIVYVQPTILRFNEGMPNLEKVNPKHADTPSWILGKVDNLAWDIHMALHKYQVMGLTGSTPEPPPYVPDGGPPDAADEVLQPLPPRDAGDETGPPP